MTDTIFTGYPVTGIRRRKDPSSGTDEYLGRITPNGLVEPKAKSILKRYSQVTVKEYGSSFLINHVSHDILIELKKRLPEWKEIFDFACMRLLHQSPMKNVEFHHLTSYLSEMLSDAHVSPDSLDPMLRRICMDRFSISGFMKTLMKDDRYLAVDLPHVLSMSEGIISATLGHNSMDEFLP